MPDPNKYKSQKEFMDACMSHTKREGLEVKARIGKCLGMWRNKGDKEDANTGK